jgi:diguanylate cyclase (GGDEF)-like protein
MSKARRVLRHWLVPERRAASSIRLRLVLLAMVAMTPLLAQRIGSLETARGDRIADAGRYALDLAQVGADRHSDLVAAAGALLVSVGHSLDRASLDIRACNRLLGEIASDIAWARALMVSDAKGRVLCSSSPQRIGTDISSRPFFGRAVESGGLSVSDLIYLQPGIEPELMAALAKRDADGTVRTVVAVAIDTQQIGQLPTQLQNKPNSAVLLVDAGGMVVSGFPDRTRWSGRDIAATPLMQRIRERGTGTTVSREAGDVARIWAFIPLPPGGGHLLVGLDERAVLRQVEQEMRVAYAQLALTVLLILLGAWFFGEHTVLGPIRALVRHAERIGRGDLSVRTGKPRWAGEFLPLARALDSMAERLAKREHDLRSQSEHFRELATLDGLTGLSNRRAFDAHIAAAWERAMTTRSTLALLMIDVDHFKRFNDRYGHLHGDGCLRAIGGILRAVSGPRVWAARFGGEEFALLITGEAADARDMAETIREVVADLGIPHLDAPAGVVTVSIGAASLVPERGTKLDSLIAAADSALYASKSRRNTVSSYEPRPLAKA